MLLDIQTYRDNENLARNTLPNWRLAQRHNLDVFEKHGFPVRLQNLQQVRQLIDTMQENRFASYMEELGGLTEAELQLLVGACRKAVRFQQENFQRMPVILPLSSLLAHLVIYQKITALRPELANLLEIGPGCGYLSFFLAGRQGLRNYAQIEACESFYLLQNQVNSFNFREAFSQEAILPCSAEFEFFTQQLTAEDAEHSLQLHDTSSKICHHYPWWHMGKLARRAEQFDVVTSNANLLEMSAAALEDYLALINQKLAPDGLFFMHCTGYPGNGTPETLYDKLHQHGFAPLLLLPGWGTPIRLQDAASGAVIEKKFTVTNGLFINRSHPLFERYNDRGNFNGQFMADLPETRRAFFPAPAPGKRSYSKEEIRDLVAASI